MTRHVTLLERLAAAERAVASAHQALGALGPSASPVRVARRAERLRQVCKRRDSIRAAIANAEGKQP